MLTAQSARNLLLNNNIAYISGVHNFHEVKGHKKFGQDKEGRINNFYTSRQFFSHFAKNVHISSVYFFDII